MVKGLSNGAQNLPVDVTKLIDQLLSPPWFSDYLLSKSTYYDLQLAREEMRKQRPHYLEAWAVYTLHRGNCIGGRVSISNLFCSKSA